MSLSIYMSVTGLNVFFQGENAKKMDKSINDSIMNGYKLTNVVMDSQGMKVQLNVDQIAMMIWED